MPKPCSLPVSSAYRWTIFRARPSPTPSIHNTELITMDDDIIIGGSIAGLAGALQLGRARRKVTVLDTGLPRNRFAGHSHGPARPRSQAAAGNPGRGAAAAGALSHDQAGQCPGRQHLRRHRRFLRPHWRWRKPWGAPPDPELWRRRSDA